MGLLKLTGPERQSWLQGMVTNEVEKLSSGQGCYAAHLNAQGKVVAQTIVLVTEDEVWLLVEKAAAAKLAGVFDKLIIMEDVQVRDASEDYDVIGLVGPAAEPILERWSGHPFQDKTLYRHQRVGAGRVCLGDLGYECIVSADTMRCERSPQRARCRSTKTPERSLRTEAGLPLYGVISTRRQRCLNSGSEGSATTRVAIWPGGCGPNQHRHVNADL
jgi:folate-binding Fe-S cluster repair protein YgfZ